MPATVPHATAHGPSTPDAPPVSRAVDDRCPGVLRPHAAQDGLLVRVRLIGGRLSPAALRAIAAATALGNGIVEITSRGNVQLRGLAGRDLPAVTELLAAAGLIPSLAHERVRGVLADPLAGRRPDALAGHAEVDAVLDAVDAGVRADAALTGLSGRFLVAVDDGSGTTDDVAADLRLCAAASGRWVVEVDGRTAGEPGPAMETVVRALDAARAFVERRAAGDAGPSATNRRAGGHDVTAPLWRIADLPRGAAEVLPADTFLGPRRPRGAAAVAAFVGTLAQRDGRSAVGVLAPLGRLDPPALDVLAGIADAHPVRVSARRTACVLDVQPGVADEIAARLRESGLVDRPDSGWDGLTACAGTDACVKAQADVRAAAVARVAARRRVGDRQREHWAACDRRCGDGPGVARSHAALAGGGWDVLVRGKVGR